MVVRGAGRDPRPPARPRDAGDPRCPADLAAPPAFLTPLVICGVLVPLAPLVWLNLEIALLALAVAIMSWTTRPAAGALAVLSSCLCLNGFRLNELGVLQPHPAVDLPVLLALSTVWLVVWAAREISLRAGWRQTFAAPGSVAQRVPQESHGDPA